MKTEKLQTISSVLQDESCYRNTISSRPDSDHHSICLSQNRITPWRPCRPGEILEFKFLDEHYAGRIVKGNSSRPGMIYLNDQAFEAFYVKLLKEELNSDQSIQKLLSQVSEIGAVYCSGVILIRELSEFSAEARKRWVGQIVHELAHFEGRGEGAAYNKQRMYEIKNGLVPTMPTNADILNTLASFDFYNKARFINAVLELIDLFPEIEFGEHINAIISSGVKASTMKSLYVIFKKRFGAEEMEPLQALYQASQTANKT